MGKAFRCSPRGFSVVLCFGWCVSTSLHVLNIFLTNRQRSYSQAIAGVGKVRYLLEKNSYFQAREFLVWRSEKVQPEKTSIWSMAADAVLCRDPTLETTGCSVKPVRYDLHLLASQLLGERLSEPLLLFDSGASEIPDKDISADMNLWYETYRFLWDELPYGQRKPLQTRWGQNIALQREAWNAMSSIDEIGDRISARAQDRIRAMMFLHAARIVLQIAFYFCLLILFKRVWMPFVKTFTDLQRLQKQQRSLLRADFDAVVEISTCRPFTVVSNSRGLDDIVGKQMLGVSILDAASDGTVRESLQDFICTGISEHAPPSTAKGGSQRRCWGLWDLIKSAKLPHGKRQDDNYEGSKQELPVALKLNSRWRRDVEIIFVGEALGLDAESTALLAVRQLPGSFSEHLPADAPSQNSSSLDFHAWAKKIHSPGGHGLRMAPIGVVGKPAEIRGVERLAASQKASMSSRSSSSSSKSNAALDFGGLRPNDRDVERLSTSHRSSSSSNNSFKAAPIRRCLIDLDSINIMIAKGSLVDEFSFQFSSESLARHGKDTRPGFLQLFVESPEFISWVLEGMRTLSELRNTESFEDNDYERLAVIEADARLEYNGEAWFRPPTSTCASSKVILSASSATLEICDISDDVMLRLHGINHLEENRSARRDFRPVETIPELPENAISL